MRKPVLYKQSSENNGVKRQTERQSVTQMFLNAFSLALPHVSGKLEVYLCFIVLLKNASTPNYSRVVHILLKILSKYGERDLNCIFLQNV